MCLWSSSHFFFLTFFFLLNFLYWFHFSTSQFIPKAFNHHTLKFIWSLKFGQYDLRTVKTHHCLVYKKWKLHNHVALFIIPHCHVCHSCFLGNLVFFCFYLMPPFKNVVALIFLTSSLEKIMKWCCQTFLLFFFPVCIECFLIMYFRKDLEKFPCKSDLPEQWLANSVLWYPLT